MKVGDKVRFLNSVGGGIVRGFKGKDVALVEDQDGFEIPILIRECIVIDVANENQTRQTAPKIAVEDSIAKAKPQAEEYKVVETKEGEKINASLAFLPVDIKNLSTTHYECYLINDSNFYLSYNYMNRGNEGWNSRATGIVEPNTKLFLEEFDKSELNDLERICVQFFAYKKDKPFALKNPCSCELRLETVKFYKLHSFKENDYFDDNALLYPLMRNDLTEKELIIQPEEIAKAIFEKKDVRERIQPIVKKEKRGIIEIDLHIHELLDTTAGLSSSDMLKYQINKFNEVMQENLKHKGQKIAFIHGKGDGILKNAISNELRIKYKQMYFQDASFQEYGYGATMVTIR